MKHVTIACFLINLLTLNSVRSEINAKDLLKLESGLSENILTLAVNAINCASKDSNEMFNTINIIDYSLPSTAKRFWSFDVINHKVLYHEFIAHGKNTGENQAQYFSNVVGSKKSSLGLFKTAGTYTGRNGYSLYLHGLEKGFNDLAYKRSIVMHGADYVSQDFIKNHGRLGRSWGCPAFETVIAKEIIDKIKHGQYLFIYYPDDNWLQNSTYLNCEN